MNELISVRNRLRDIFGGECGKITKTDIKEAAELREYAEKGVELAVPYAKSLARELELELGEGAVEVGPTKTLGRMFEKAIGKLGGVNHLDELGDVGRLRVLINGPDDILELRRKFGSRNVKSFPLHPTNNVAVTGIQDYVWEPSPTGRIAFHVDLEVAISGSKSVGVEIQFVDHRMVRTDKATHMNYQKACLIERTARKEGREPTPQEVEAMKNYRESNKRMYLADSLNYGYYNLRRPDLQREVDLGPQLRLAG